MRNWRMKLRSRDERAPDLYKPLHHLCCTPSLLTTVSTNNSWIENRSKYYSLLWGVGYSGSTPTSSLFLLLLLKLKFLVQIRGHIKNFPRKWLKAIAYFSFGKAFSIRGTGLFQKKMYMPGYAIFRKMNPTWPSKQLRIAFLSALS